MEAVFSILVGIFFSVAIYLMLSRHSIRVLLGIAILGSQPKWRDAEVGSGIDVRTRVQKHLRSADTGMITGPVQGRRAIAINGIRIETIIQ